MVRLGDVCNILDSMRVPITATKRTKGKYPYYGANGIQDYIDSYIFNDELVLLAEDGGHFGSKEKPIAYRVSGKCWVNNHAHVLKPKELLNVDFLCYSIMFYDVTPLINGTTRPKLNQESIRKIIIPLPPLNEQERIVKIIETKLNSVKTLFVANNQQIKLIELLISAYFNYYLNDKTITKEWKQKTLGEICEFIYGASLPQQIRKEGDIPVYGSNGQVGLHNKYLINESTIIVGRKGSIGEVHFSNMPCWVIDTAYYVKTKNEINIEYLFRLLKYLKLSKLNKSSAIPGLNRDDIYKIKITLPQISEQKEIINNIEIKEKHVKKIINILNEQAEYINALSSSILRKAFNGEY